MPHIFFACPAEGTYLSYLPYPFDRWDASSTRPEAVCGLNSTGTSSLYYSAIAAILRYIDILLGKSKGYVGLVQQGVWSAEYTLNTGDTVVVQYNSNNGLYQAVVCKGPSDAIQYDAYPKLGLKKKFVTSAPFLMAMIPAMREKSPEFDSNFQEFYWKFDAGTPEEAENSLRYLVDYMFYSIEKGEIRCVNKPTGIVDLLSKKSVESGVLEGVPVIGKAEFVQGTGTETAENAEDPAAAENENSLGVLMELPMFKQFRERVAPLLRKSDFDLIPQMDKKLIVPKWALRVARSYVVRADFISPCNSIRIEGPTGVGKSFALKMVAQLLGIPYFSINLNADTDTVSLKSQVVPKTSAEKPMIPPTEEDFMYAPERAWEKMTGEKKENVTEEEARALYASITSQKDLPFVRVLSDLMEPLHRGIPCLIEIQELSRARPGVVSGLNEVFDVEGWIHLEATGERFKRNPLSLIVSTDNFGYAGCKKISPDVRRRFKKCIRLRKPDKEETVARIQKRIGFADLTALGQMYDIVMFVAKYCAEHNITDGDVGPAELEDWASALMMEPEYQLPENAEEAFREQVLTKATGDSEDEDALFKEVCLSSEGTGFFTKT